MTDEATPDLTLLVRRAEKAASDAQGAVAAMERLFATFAPRVDSIEARLEGIERRQSMLEASLARSHMLIHGPVYREATPRANTDDDRRFWVEP